MSETANDCSPMTPEQLEKATNHGPTDFEIAMASVAGQGYANSFRQSHAGTDNRGYGQLQYAPQMITRPSDPMADLHAAIKFLKWCQANQKSTKLGEEWLVAEAKKLAT